MAPGGAGAIAYNIFRSSNLTRKYITPAARRCNKYWPKNSRGKSHEQLLEEAGKARSLPAQERAWADPRLQGKVHDASTPYLPLNDDGVGARSFRNSRTAEPAKLRLTPRQWDEYASRAKGGDQHALNTLWRAAFPFAVALAVPFCKRNTALSAEALASEALYPISKKSGEPIFGLLGSLDAWEPNGGRPFVQFLRVIIEGNIRKSLRGRKSTVPLDEKTGACHGDGIFDGDGFNVEAAIAAFDELEADLTDTERHVLSRHRNGDTDRMIGDGLSVSRERARQIRISAVSKLTR
jgi:hypothetical protein